MNRNQSTDSLDKCNDENNGYSSASSSPAEFTSDDETISNNMFLTSRNKAPMKQNIRLSSSNKMQGNTVHDKQGYSFVQSYRDKRNSIRKNYNEPRNIDIQDYINDENSLYQNPNIETFVDDEMMSNTWRNLNYSQSSKANTSNANMYIGDDKRAPITSSLGISMIEQNLFKSSLPKQVWFPDSQSECNEALMLCSQIYHCPTIYETLILVDKKRDLINSLTKPIIDAPAYRNYDMTQYKIDHSVKESFNPTFWSDREPVVTTADGNCQYHAVSLSLTGTEAYTSEVRLATAVAVLDNRDWFDSVLKLMDRGSVMDLMRTIVKSFSWGDETTLKAIAIAIKRRIYLYTCNIGKKDFEHVKSLTKDELIDAFRNKKFRGGTGIHAYADPLVPVSPNNYIMLFHKSEHFIAVLPYSQQPTNYEPYNPIVPVFI